MTLQEFILKTVDDYGGGVTLDELELELRDTTESLTPAVDPAARGFHEMLINEALATGKLRTVPFGTGFNQFIYVPRPKPHDGY